MTRFTTILLLTLASAAAVRAADEPPLPPGALARLGDTPYRPAEGAATSLSPDGRRLALADWSITYRYTERYGLTAVSGDGRLTVSHYDETATGKPASELAGTGGYLGQLQLSADGRVAMTEAPGATALVWSLRPPVED